MANIQLSSESSKAYIDYAASVINSEVQTMTSLQIAEVTNKRHDAVLRDIRNLLEQGVAAHNFVVSEYTDKTGRTLPCYELTKKGCLILASGYNALLREKIINRWELLETERAVVTPDNPQLQFVQTQIYLAETISRNLRLNEASRLGMYQSIAALPPRNSAVCGIKGSDESTERLVGGYALALLSHQVQSDARSAGIYRDKDTPVKRRHGQAVQEHYRQRTCLRREFAESAKPKGNTASLVCR